MSERSGKTVQEQLEAVMATKVVELFRTMIEKEELAMNMRMCIDGDRAPFDIRISIDIIPH